MPAFTEPDFSPIFVSEETLLVVKIVQKIHFLIAFSVLDEGFTDVCTHSHLVCACVQKRGNGRSPAIDGDGAMSSGITSTRIEEVLTKNRIINKTEVSARQCEAADDSSITLNEEAISLSCSCYNGHLHEP